MGAGTIVAPERDSAPIGSDMILAAAIIISIISIIVPGAVFSSLFRIAGAGDSPDAEVPADVGRR